MKTMKTRTIHGLLITGILFSASLNLFGKEISIFLNGWASWIQVPDSMGALLILGTIAIALTGTVAMILGVESKIKDVQAIGYMFTATLLGSTSFIWACYSLSLMA